MSRKFQKTTFAVVMCSLWVVGANAAYAVDAPTQKDQVVLQGDTLTLTNTGVGARNPEQFPNFSPEGEYKDVKNLVINYDPYVVGEAAPIRNAKVSVENVTIKVADLTEEVAKKYREEFETAWEKYLAAKEEEEAKPEDQRNKIEPPGSQSIIYKGIYAGERTEVVSTGKISVTSPDDGLYTEGNGHLDVSGFKEMSIDFGHYSYGIVNNANGINIKGDKGSKLVLVQRAPNKFDFPSMDAMPHPSLALANGAFNAESERDPLPGVLNVDVGTLDIHSADQKDVPTLIYGIYNYTDKTPSVINADEIVIKDTIFSIRNVNGGLKIDPKKKALVQLNGKVENSNGQLEINMSKDNSYIVPTFEDGPVVALYTEIDGKQPDVDKQKLTINVLGNDSKIIGSVVALGHGGHLELTVDGNDFKGGSPVEVEPQPRIFLVNGSHGKVDFNGDRAIVKWLMNSESNGLLELNVKGKDFNLINEDQSGTADPVIKASESSTSKVIIDGARASVIGKVVAVSGGNLILNSKGSSMKLMGEVSIADASDSDSPTLLTATFSGVDAKVVGNLNNMDEKGTYHFEMNGGQGTLEGDLNAEQGQTTLVFDNNSVWKGSGKTGNVQDTTSSVTLNHGSIWKMTKNSNVSKLAVDSSSIVSMEGDAKRLEVGTLQGSGDYIMDLTYLNADTVVPYKKADKSDYIIATGGSGLHTVKLTPQSSLDGMKKGSKLYFATAPGSTFKVHEIEHIDKIYNQPIHVGNDGAGEADWFLTIDPDEKVINPNGLVPDSAYANVLALWRDNDTLLKRLGELRYVEENPGWWGRYINTKLKNNGEHAFKGTWQTIQLGWDKKQVVDEETQRYWGLGLDYKWGKPDYNMGSGKQHMYDLTLYLTQFKDDGRYVDLVGRVGRIHTKYTTAYGDKGSFRNWAASIGAELGQKRHFNENWTYEPQAQLTYGRVWGTDFTTDKKVRVHQTDADSLVGRLGIVLAREFDGDKENPRRIYAKASVLHDFLGKAKSSVNQEVIFNDSEDFGGTWYVLGLGTNYNFNKNCQFYFDAERSFGGDVKMKYRFNAGLRYKF